MLAKFRSYIIAAIALGLLALGLGTSVLMAAGNNDGKVTLCHATGSGYNKITVSANAVPAHMNHGDAVPDDYGDCP